MLPRRYYFHVTNVNRMNLISKILMHISGSTKEILHEKISERAGENELDCLFDFSKEIK